MDIEPAAGLGHNQPPEPTLEDRLTAIDPTNLLVVSLDDLPKLLDLQFAALANRGAELVAGIARWKEDHDDGRKPIADDAENAILSDWMRQLSDYAGADGEADTARKSVKRVIFEAGKMIDGWFGALRDPIVAAIGPARNAPLGTLQQMQTAYLVAKADRARLEQERIAREAKAEADKLAAEARKLEAEEEARMKAMVAAGVEKGDAEAAIAARTDDAYATAANAMNQAEAAFAGIGTAPQAAARQRTALGTTTGLQMTWEAEVVDVLALAKAVAAGTAPVTFLTANVSAINAAVRQKVAPLRDCPGVNIRQVAAARRTGR